MLSSVQLVIPWTVASQAPLSMRFSSENTGVGCHFFLQGMFPTQESNPGLLHCRQVLSQLSYKGSPLVIFVLCNTSLQKTTFAYFNIQVLYFYKLAQTSSFPVFKLYLFILINEGRRCRSLEKALKRRLVDVVSSYMSLGQSLNFSGAYYLICKVLRSF